MKYSCPKCKSKLDIQKTFNKKFLISCTCGIEDLLDYTKNIDEIYLEFLSRYDEGRVSEKNLSEGVKREGMIREEAEINKMIQGKKIDKITESVLFTKKRLCFRF